MDLCRSTNWIPAHASLLLRPCMHNLIRVYQVQLTRHWQNQSSVAAQAKQFPLKKPGGFHWDFFLLGCTSFIAGIIDIPLPNGLVPQAPVHTDCMTNYKSELKVIKTDDGHEIRQQEIIAESVREQRVSHFLMGLAIIGTMTGPILVVLNLIPRALFAGVFFVVGWAGLEGNGIMAKIIYLIREPRFIQPDEPLLQVPRKRILFYLFWQVFGITATVGVSQTIAGIGNTLPIAPRSTERIPERLTESNPGFPVLIIALIPLRWKILPKLFTAKELRAMDAPTADNEVVLASMGGAPRVPGSKDESPATSNSTDGTQEEEKWAAAERGGLSKRAGGMERGVRDE